MKHPCLNDTNEFECQYVKYFKYDKEDESRLINIFHIIGYAWTDDMKDSYSKDKAELLVVYETCYQNNIEDERNQIYTRKFSNFLAKVDKEKYPETKQEYIFEPCSSYELLCATHSYYAKKERDSRYQSVSKLTKVLRQDDTTGILDLATRSRKESDSNDEDIINEVDDEPIRINNYNPEKSDGLIKNRKRDLEKIKRNKLMKKIER